MSAEQNTGRADSQQKRAKRREKHKWAVIAVDAEGKEYSYIHPKHSGFEETCTRLDLLFLYTSVFVSDNLDVIFYKERVITHKRSC